MRGGETWLATVASWSLGGSQAALSNLPHVDWLLKLPIVMSRLRRDGFYRHYSRRKRLPGAPASLRHFSSHLYV